MSYLDDEDDESDEVREVVAAARYRPPVAQAGNPALLAWPVTLPMEIALQAEPVKTICQNLGITRERWDELRVDVAFQAEVGRALEAIRVDGVGFRLRAALQAGELLKTSWGIIHDPSMPPAVRADLLKATVKWGGLDASKQADIAKPGVGFQILINLGG